MRWLVPLIKVGPKVVGNPAFWELARNLVVAAAPVALPVAVVAAAGYGLKKALED